MVDKSPDYLMNKGGVFYFTRHVPDDLQQQYEHPRIVMCLKTASKKMALRASHALASKLDDFWLKMRISDIDTSASHLLVKGQTKEVFISSAPTLSDSLAMYCNLKDKDRAKMFFTAANRNVGYVIQHLGNRPIDTYSSLDAASFRDWLVERNLSSSSISSTVRAVINLTIQ